MNDDNTYTITGYSGDYDAIILPSKHQGQSVTAIGREAFRGCSAAFVTIPSSIREIGNSAFMNAKLTMVEIPDGMEKIGNYAFDCCYDLTTVYLAGSEIGRAVFTSCVKLTNVFIDKNAGQVSMGKEVFNTCLNLENIYCASSTKGSNWNEDWKGSNEHANVIWDCELTENGIFQNHNYNVIVGYMDFDWINPHEYMTINYNNYQVTLGEDGYECSYRAYVTVIGDSAFRDCSAVTCVVLDGVVEHIGAYAFAGCKNLTEVYIFGSVTTIDENAFSGCNNLTKIYCSAKSIPEGWDLNWKKDCLAQVIWSK